MEKRRVRTFWKVRRRYRLMANLAAATGGLTALALAAFVIWSLVMADVTITVSLIIILIVFIAVMAFVPRWFILSLWRRKRRAHALDGE